MSTTHTSKTEDNGAEEFLTAGGAARMLGVSIATIRRAADAGQLPFHPTPGGHRRFLVDDIRAFRNGDTEATG